MQRNIGSRRQHSTNGVNGHTNGEAVDLDLDAVVIGAGFAGVYLLHRLRQEGFKVKLVEAGSGLGGIWHWNRYPGARVDSHYPIYALSIPEVYSTWQWTEKYPGHEELNQYFQHIDKCIDVSKDTLYHTRVTKAAWDNSDHKWHIECENGTRIKTTFMNCCLGFAAKRHFPDWPGLQDYRGEICHSSFWPNEGIDLKGKKVGVVGNGATGIQIAQAAARDASELTVFIRTPNLCIPMRQSNLDPKELKDDMSTMGYKLGKQRFETIGGFLYSGKDMGMLDDQPEERDRVLQEGYDEGGFAMLFSYNDILINQESNDYLYDFWVKRTRERISNPEKRDILAPLEPPHPFAGKRPSLEQDYYEQMDKDHVKIVNLKKTKVSKVVPEGIVTDDGVTHQFDVIAIATGFDSLTGGFTEIDIHGIDNELLREKWSGELGALSYLGLTVHNFPNMFYTYGPHAPTAYGNGPSIVEPQGEWIVDVIKRMRDAGQTKINAQEKPELDWKETVNKLHAMTLRDKVDSWYMGTNIPGKPRQALNYAGGLPLYVDTIRGKLDNNFEGFDIT